MDEFDNLRSVLSRHRGLLLDQLTGEGALKGRQRRQTEDFLRYRPWIHAEIAPHPDTITIPSKS